VSKKLFDIFNSKKNNVSESNDDTDQINDSALFESSSTTQTCTENRSNKDFNTTNSTNALQYNKLTIISDLGTLETGPVRPLLKVGIFIYFSCDL